MSYCRCDGVSHLYIYESVYGGFDVFKCEGCPPTDEGNEDYGRRVFDTQEEVLEYIREHNLYVPDYTIERLEREIAEARDAKHITK